MTNCFIMVLYQSVIKEQVLHWQIEVNPWHLSFSFRNSLQTTSEWKKKPNLKRHSLLEILTDLKTPLSQRHYISLLFIFSLTAWYALFTSAVSCLSMSFSSSLLDSCTFSVLPVSPSSPWLTVDDRQQV